MIINYFIAMSHDLHYLSKTFLFDKKKLFDYVKKCQPL